jgi:hypothetical protein
VKASLLEKALNRAHISNEDRAYMESVLAAGGQAFIGRGMYPRFVRPNDREFPGKTAELTQPFRRLVFELVGSDDIQVIMPLDIKPEFFPNGADVVLITTVDSQPAAVFVFDANQAPQGALFRSPGKR